MFIVKFFDNQFVSLDFPIKRHWCCLDDVELKDFAKTHEVIDFYYLFDDEFEEV